MSGRAWLCACAWALAVGGVAPAHGAISVATDHLRVEGGGVHRIWVQVVDGDGSPVQDLGASSFDVEVDDRPVRDLDVEPWSKRFDRLDLTMVVDGEIAMGPGRRAVQRVLAELGEAAGEKGRVRLVAAGERWPAIEASGREARELAGRVGELEAGAGPARLYDALTDQVRRARRLPADTGPAVIVVTRAQDAGSRRRALDVLALAASPDARVPLLVALLEDGPTPEGDRLSRLVARTGGALLRFRELEQLRPTVERLLPRASTSYLLRFKPESWDAAADRHRLEITVKAGGARLDWQEDYETSAVMAVAWWRRPALWLWVAALAALGLVAFLSLRRRPLFDLVVDRGDDEGCRYQVFSTPLTLGASQGNDLTLPVPRLSRNHCVLERRGAGIEIVDLNSENGTFINGERVTRRLLADGDHISLGGAVEFLIETRG